MRTLSATAALVASAQAMGRMTRLSSARSAPPSSPGRPPSSAPLPCQTYPFQIAVERLQVCMHKAAHSDQQPDDLAIWRPGKLRDMGILT